MSGLYDKGRQGFLDGSIDWDSDDIRAILIDTANYAVNLAVHDNLDDIPPVARVQVSGSLTGKTATNGVADADDVTYAGVTGNAIVIYKHTGTESTSRLIAYIDGLSISTIVQWDNGPNRIFKL